MALSLRRRVVALGLGLAACGGDATGEAGSGGSDEPSPACSVVCMSPCAPLVDGVPSDVAECLEVCAATALSEICQFEVVAFFRCFESNGCRGGECDVQAIQFGRCFSLPPTD